MYPPASEERLKGETVKSLSTFLARSSTIVPKAPSVVV